MRGYGKDGKDFKEYKGKEIAAPECPPTNAFVQPYIFTPLTPQVPPVVSPEQPPTGGGG